MPDAAVNFPSQQAHPVRRFLRQIGPAGPVALLVTAITPALLMLSQSRLSKAANAFNKGNCQRASSQALASLDYMAMLWE